MNSRKNSLTKVLNCLNKQTIKPDKIYVWNNNEAEFNYTDNAKFEPIRHLDDDTIVFTMDDDIYYPPTYIEDTIKQLKLYNYNAIITYHGRKLLGLNRNYYRGHTAYACLHDVDYQGQIDVAGTGVTCFYTGYFKPIDIYKSEYKRMSDCVFSLEAAKQGKQIIVLKHKRGYLKDICDDVINSCHRLESKDPINQNKIADEIYTIKYIRSFNPLPKVSIIIPFKTDRGYLQEAIDSIHKQTYEGEIEIIYSQSDNGVSYNLNRGIERATGEYIKYLCDDDRLTPHSIEKAIETFKSNPTIDFIHGNAINFYNDGKEDYHLPKVKYPKIKDLLLFNHIHGGTLMYRKSIFDNFKFDETLWTGEEFDFNLKLLYNGLTIGYCNHFLYEYRRHDEQKSIGNTDRAYQLKRREQKALIKKRYF
jgi:glycosyltransferase involved in cell wall biosynthesis